MHSGVFAASSSWSYDRDLFSLSLMAFDNYGFPVDPKMSDITRYTTDTAHQHKILHIWKIQAFWKNLAISYSS